MSAPRTRRDPVVWVILGIVLVFALPVFMALGLWVYMAGSPVGPATTGLGLVGLGALVVVVAFVLVFLVRAIRSVPRRPPYLLPSAGPVRPTAAEVLDARYVRGEISRDEYRRMRRDLRSNGP